MSRSTPRRPSRTTTPRPRKIAGREETTETSAAAEAAPAKSSRAAAEPPKPPKPPRRPVADGTDETRPGDASGRTSTLLAGVGVLVLVLVLQCAWFVWNAVRDEAVTSAPVATDGAVVVPSGRPVVLNQVSVQGGVEAAAAAAQVMFARSWKRYDEGVEDAVALMTEDFGEEFRTTTEDVRAEFVRTKTEVEVRVVAQSVVRANETELEALVFLNQYVFRGQGEEGTSTYTPYRALLTMVHTDAGWLVDGVDTK